MGNTIGHWTGAVVLCIACSAAGMAQAGEAAAFVGQAPGGSVVAAQMRVARLSHVAGQVTVSAEDGTQVPTDAVLNMPLIAGTRLFTGDAGEAEVEFADGSVLRLTPGSAAAIARMDAAGAELELGNGLFYLELRASDRSAYGVLAGDVSIAPEENAGFRVRVQDGQVETAVLAGTVSVTRMNAYTAQVDAGESLRTDPKNGRRYLLAQSVGPESWDSWNERLAQTAQDEQASRTTARDSYAGDQGYGWSDLDAQGQWYDVAGEGTVWQPTLADAGFDPYGNGSWVSGPGGYTWASGYGWGWLPYRCGAWSFYAGFGWGWLPSTSCLNFGFGSGVDGGFGGGGVRVGHPPTGWRPPLRPLPGRERRPPPSPILTRLQPPLPRSADPVRIGGVVVTPLPRVGHGQTPQGGSAVGSSLLRDFPVRAGTHQPVLGLVSQLPIVLPGRQPAWVRQGSAFASQPVGGGSLTGSASAFGQRRLPRPSDPPLGATGAPPLGANGPVPVGANGTTVFSGGTRLPLNANGASPVGANGATPIGANGAVPLGANGPAPLGANGAAPVGAGGTLGLGSGASTLQGDRMLRRGRPEDANRLASPLHPRLIPPGTTTIAPPQVIVPNLTPVPRTQVPAAPPAPRVSVPAAPAAPRVAPVPVAPAVVHSK